MIPKAYLIVGFPCSGKSQWVTEQGFDWSKVRTASTNEYIEHFAKQRNTTYDAVYSDLYNKALQRMRQTIKLSTDERRDIVFDQTHLSIASRRRKLEMLPPMYYKIAVLIDTDMDLIKERMPEEAAKGKSLPVQEFLHMQSIYEPPSHREGFDEVWTIGSDLKHR